MLVIVCVYHCFCLSALTNFPPLVRLQLTAAKQRSIAEELERTPGEVLKKLEDIRNKIL